MTEAVATPGRVRPMRDADLAQVLSWRNHPDVRQHLFTRHEISPEEHRSWFSRCMADPKRRLLIYERGACPVGFVSFSVGPHPKVADWGFYAAPGAPRGTGRALGRAALDHAFGPMELHKVCGQAVQSNRRSIACHEALGFRREGLLREQHFDGLRFEDVICFGILASEWARQN